MGYSLSCKINVYQKMFNYNRLFRLIYGLSTLVWWKTYIRMYVQFTMFIIYNLYVWTVQLNGFVKVMYSILGVQGCPSCEGEGSTCKLVAGLFTKVNKRDCSAIWKKKHNIPNRVYLYVYISEAQKTSIALLLENLEFL